MVTFDGSFEPVCSSTAPFVRFKSSKSSSFSSFSSFSVSFLFFVFFFFVFFCLIRCFSSCSANAKVAQSKHKVFPVPVGDSNKAFVPSRKAKRIFSIMTICDGYGSGNGNFTEYETFWTMICIGGG